MALSAIVHNTESFKWNVLDSCQCKCLNKVLFTPIVIASDTQGRTASKFRYSHFISSIQYNDRKLEVYWKPLPSLTRGAVVPSPIWRLETLVTWSGISRPVGDVWQLLISMTVNYTILRKGLLLQHLTLLEGHFFKHHIQVWCWSDGFPRHLDISQHSNTGHGGDLSSFRGGEGNFKNDALEKVSWRIFIAAKRE